MSVEGSDSGSVICTELTEILLELDNQEEILDDRDRFKLKLGIPDTIFSEMIDVGTAGTAGAGAAGITYLAWTATLSGFAKFCMAIPLIGGTIVSAPIIPIVGLGGATAATAYGIQKARRGIRKKKVIEGPQFTHAPINVLGATVASVLVTMAVYVAASDGEITEDELLMIVNHLVDKWGYNKEFVEKAVRYHVERVEVQGFNKFINGLSVMQQDLDGPVISKRIEELTEQAVDATIKEEIAKVKDLFLRHRDVNLKQLGRDISGLVQEVVERDGIVAPGEKAAIQAIKGVFK